MLPHLSGIDGPIAELMLDRPQTLNALTDEDVRALPARLDEAADAPGVRALVLHGAGRSFCAGADLGVLDRIRGLTDAEREQFIRPMLGMIKQLTRFPRPTVAAVQGNCVGAGVGLALACDRVVASADATFGLVFARLGLPAGDAGALWLASRRIGAHRAWQLFAEAPMLDATAAHALGLIDEVVAEPGQLLDAAREAAAGWARRAPTALAVSKEQALQAQGAFEELDELTDDLVAAICTALGSAEFAEGLAAVREKRDPDWDQRPDRD